MPDNEDNYKLLFDQLYYYLYIIEFSTFTVGRDYELLWYLIQKEERTAYERDSGLLEGMAGNNVKPHIHHSLVSRRDGKLA